MTNPNVLEFLNARDIVMVSLVNKETYSKVKSGEMVCKSISQGHLPSEYRREYWSNSFIMSTEFNYNEVTKKAFADTDLEFTKDEISRDVPRTYLVNTCEGDKDALMRMLVVFAFCHPEIRYCQGLNFVAGVLYKALGEGDGTKCLLGMVAKYQLDGLFAPGLPDLHLKEYQMNHYIHKYFPKLFAHFKENSVTTGFFIARWFMTLYSVYLPYETLLRIWDFFMTKGWKALFQTGLAIFDEIQEILLELDLQGVAIYIRDHARNDHLDYSKLLKTALARKVTNTELKKLEEEFYINQAGLKIERIQTVHIDQDVLQVTKSQLERFEEPVMSDINYFKTVLEDLVKDLHRKLKEFFRIQQQISEIERRVEHLCELKAEILENIHTCQKQPKPKKTVVVCEKEHEFPTIICLSLIHI